MSEITVCFRKMWVLWYFHNFSERVERQAGNMRIVKIPAPLCFISPLQRRRWIWDEWQFARNGRKRKRGLWGLECLRFTGLRNISKAWGILSLVSLIGPRIASWLQRVQQFFVTSMKQSSWTFVVAAYSADSTSTVHLILNMYWIFSQKNTHITLFLVWWFLLFCFNEKSCFDCILNRQAYNIAFVLITEIHVKHNIILIV